VPCSFNREGNLHARKSRALDQLLLYREGRGTVTALILLPMPSLKMAGDTLLLTGEPEDFVSLSLCCAKEPFAYLHRSFKKH